VKVDTEFPEFQLNSLEMENKKLKKAVDDAIPLIKLGLKLAEESGWASLPNKFKAFLKKYKIKD